MLLPPSLALITTTPRAYHNFTMKDVDRMAREWDFSEAEARPHLIFVRAGTLDDPEIGRPLASIWLSQAPSWACIDDQLPRFDGQPPPAR